MYLKYLFLKENKNKEQKNTFIIIYIMNIN